VPEIVSPCLTCYFVHQLLRRLATDLLSQTDLVRSLFARGHG
jgi:hypothetical protein